MSTLTSRANGLLNDARRLVNELSSLAATCSLRSVRARCKYRRPAISFIKWLVSMVFILSIVKRIQTEFRFDIKTSVFFIGTKFRGDMKRSCSIVAKSKYASLHLEQTRSQLMFSPACASASYGSTQMNRRKNTISYDTIQHVSQYICCGYFCNIWIQHRHCKTFVSRYTYLECCV